MRIRWTVKLTQSTWMNKWPCSPLVTPKTTVVCSLNTHQHEMKSSGFWPITFYNNFSIDRNYNQDTDEDEDEEESEEVSEEDEEDEEENDYKAMGHRCEYRHKGTWRSVIQQCWNHFSLMTHICICINISTVDHSPVAELSVAELQ